MRLCMLLIVCVSFGCATTYADVQLDNTQKIKRVRVVKVSALRKGPYKASVTLPTKDGMAKVDIKGNDEAMSGNLAMTGAAAGALFGGPVGAASGGIVGTFAEWVKDKLGVSSPLEEGPEELTTEEPEAEAPKVKTDEEIAARAARKAAREAKKAAKVANEVDYE